MKTGFVAFIQWLTGRRAIEPQLGSAHSALLRLGHSPEGVGLELAQHQTQLYERLRTQLVLGSLNGLLSLSVDRVERLAMRNDILLLKLSAVLQSGDMAAARALARSLLSHGCEKEQLARAMTAALVFSQARLSLLVGLEDKARTQYAEGLDVLQFGMDNDLLAEAWVSRQKTGVQSGVINV